MIKILATTLGETGGDLLSMSLNLGYLLSTFVFMAVFIGFVLMQIRARRFHPAVYWATIIASTTVGTTLADYTTRSLGIGYTGGFFGYNLARLAPNTGPYRCGVYLHAQGRRVLLVDHHVFSNAGYGAGRLDV